MDSNNDPQTPSPGRRRSSIRYSWLSRFLRVFFASIIGYFASTQSLASSESEYATLRQAMVREVEAIADYAGTPMHGTLDSIVLAAIAKVPRHAFVPQRQKPYAYENRPLPIGYGQTI